MVDERALLNVRTKTKERELLAKKEAGIELDAIKASMGKMPLTKTELEAAMSKVIINFTSLLFRWT